MPPPPANTIVIEQASICFEIQFRIPYVMREWTGSHTRVGSGGEKESKCLQKKTQLGDVRF